ncbi:MAG: A/G-specific adenine glycosylase [Treponema sp.]
MNKLSYSEFQQTILEYYHLHGREFPWRVTDDPYAVLVSEFMLQQTQTERVVEKYNRWLDVFPTVQSLAASSLAEVLEQWVGLGYNRRARFLHQCAQHICSEHQGIVPREPAVLQTLPGIGAYTAAAVSTFSYNLPHVFIETNIRAVFIFFFFKDRMEIPDKEIFPLIESSLYTDNPRLWYYALMDYGAELKKKVVNPNRKSKHYTKQSKFEGSVRQARGAVIRSLTDAGAQRYEDLLLYAEADKDLFEKALSSLIQEGFVAEKNGIYTIGS